MRQQAILAETSLPTCGLLARNNFRLARHPPGIGLRHYLANGKTIIKAEHASVGLFHFADRRE
jgi:hypothetical protein